MIPSFVFGVVALVVLPYTAHAGGDTHRLHPEIWFGPMQNRYDADLKVLSWNYFDFLSMLSADSPWQHAARRITAIMIDVNHAAPSYERTGTPPLLKIGAMIRRLKVGVGGGGAVVYTDGGCQGEGVEGMSSDKDFAKEVYFATKSWHDAGMPLTHFIMDGPFYFGYKVSGKKCKFSIEDVARRAAKTMTMIRDLYPNVMVIDAEGPGKESPSDWLIEYKRFLKAFQVAYGKRIDFLDMDLHWSDTWKTGYSWIKAAKLITNAMHERKIRVSLIINADDTSIDPDVNTGDREPFLMSSEYWISAVRKHIDLVKKEAIPLDALDLESWMKYPIANLPESDATSWTSCINYAYKVLFTHDP